MRPCPSPSLTLNTLAIQWRVLGVFAVAFARQVLRLGSVNPHKALQKAEILEAWLCGALLMLSQQIASAERRPEDRSVGARLQAIAAALMALALFIQYLKRSLLSRIREDDPVAAALPVFRSLLRGVPAYIDTS